MVVVLYAFFFKKLTQTATAATNDINKGVIISCFILNKNRYKLNRIKVESIDYFLRIVFKNSLKLKLR